MAAEVGFYLTREASASGDPLCDHGMKVKSRYVPLSSEASLVVTYEAIVDQLRVLLGHPQVPLSDFLMFLQRVSRHEHKRVRGDYLVLGRHRRFGWAGYVGATGDLYGESIGHREKIDQAINGEDTEDW